VVFDSSGNLYIADTNNSRVREVSGSNINTIAGNGTAGFAGDGSGATSAELNSPSGLTFDSNGNLYMADSDNFAIRKVAGGTISSVAGKNTGMPYGGDLGPATLASLSTPTGVAVDSSGNIYIADGQNNAVRVVCQTQTPIACTNAAFGSDTWAAGDINTFSGNEVTGAGYQGDGNPATTALLNDPDGVTLDAAGNLYIADAGNSAIRKVDTRGIITTFAGDGSGNAGYSGDGGPATKAQLSNPKSVAVDSNGNVYIADTGNSVIRMVDPSGIITTIAGISGSFGYSGDGGAATSAQLNFPSGVAVNAGKVYIADNDNNVIRLLTPAPAIPQIYPKGVVNGASYTMPVVPGSIADVFGTFFLTSSSGATSLPLETSLQNLSFQFSGGTEAPLFYVSGPQADFQVPWELAVQTTATLAATLNGQTGATQTVNVAPFAPAIFTLNSQGTGAGVILDASYQQLSSVNQAIPGTTYILIYCTGLGAVSANQPATGAPASSDPNKLAPTASPVTVTIGTVTENASFAGLAPGFVGLYQVNALVPTGTAADNAVPVTITIGGVTSNTVTIPVAAAAQ